MRKLFSFPASRKLSGYGRRLALLLLSALALLRPLGASAQYIVFTLAGGGSANGTTVGTTDGTGTAALFSSPAGVALDAAGNVYVADYANNKIRKVTAAGVVTTLAGGGATGATSGSADGTGTAALFNRPYGVAVDATGTVYVAEYGGNKIRKVTAAGVTTTLAGGGATGTTSGSADGTGTAALFNGPDGVALDAVGNVYVADLANNKIRKVTAAGVVTTLVGGGATGTTPGATDGTGTAALFSGPSGVAVDAAGNVYVADRGNNKIRKVTAGGVVTTLAGGGTSGLTPGATDGTGTAALFNFPSSVAVDAAGNVYVADGNNNKTRKVTAGGVVTTLAGGGATGTTSGFMDGTGTAALFNFPSGVAVDVAGNVYVGDFRNNKIREVTAAVAIPAPTLTSLNPTSGPVGTSVTLTGTNLSSATSVRFNGTAATVFAVVNATTVTAFVPVGATTGPATITTAGGTTGGITFTVTTPSATARSTAADFSLFPNPAHEAFTVTLPAGTLPTQAELLNALGQVVRRPAVSGASFQVETSGLAPGVYTLRLQVAGAATLAKRVVVE
ncbi:IPT/TIG domain-containing protein [Hymenobacter rubidus]|uniref:IPT/TIG domain-containing protein n=1 Tax=Hymenobacter rubidus TaxID=1441626 RepID=UPI00191EDF9C|nr:IPT/TIG domain-containing protein [Hymenobacter rubidus]